jgi:hypothetical protein
MGTGKAYSLHETDSTRASGAAHKFDEILERVVAAGGEIVSDDELALLIDMGMDEADIGVIRTVEFNINRKDFKMIRKIEDRRVIGEGTHKSLEDLDPPKVKITLKSKPEIEDDWTIVDLDDMF